MPVKLNLIAAACENMGIGKNNKLPWNLRSEMKYFANLTTSAEDKNKKNVVIMGRKTWEGIPPKFKPLKNRINFVLSRSKLNFEDYDNKDLYGFTSWDEIYDKLNDNKFMEEYESVWVIGGSNIYKDSMESDYFHRLYLTEIREHFECDTFMPALGNHLKLTRDANISEEVQEENGIKFQYKIYENTKYSA